MCLYPKFILNKRYLPNKSNNYNPPICTDERKRYVPIGCGNCIECRKQKARQWQVRLSEELKRIERENKGERAYFVTLTFTNESLIELAQGAHNHETNAVATRAVRLFLERWRKCYAKSVKHWLITELGHSGTERIHLHGIIFTEHNLREVLPKIWKYGRVDTGQYCNQRTINYIVKYVTKIDTDHKDYRPIILCSKGLGAYYMIRERTANRFEGADTNATYRLPNGARVNLPIYYRNKKFTEAQREELWTHLLDKGEIYVLGVPHPVKDAETQRIYNKVLRSAQEMNTRLGYGDDTNKWKEREYNITLKMLNRCKKDTN